MDTPKPQKTHSITAANLLVNGYRTFPVTRDEYRIGGFQKRVRDESGRTLYFITVYQWAFPGENRTKQLSYEFEVHFYRDDSSDAFVEYKIHTAPSIEYAEQMYAEVYAKMGFAPDRYNND